MHYLTEFVVSLIVNETVSRTLEDWPGEKIFRLNLRSKAIKPSYFVLKDCLYET